jgi:hypothetical protein
MPAQIKADSIQKSLGVLDRQANENQPADKTAIAKAKYKIRALLSGG